MNAGSNPVDAAPEAPRPQQPLQAPPMIQVQQPTTRTAVGWPSAIARFSDDLDGMDAKQVVSIIGNLIISQHKYTALPTFATPSSAPSAASNPLATDAPDRQMQTLVPQQTAGATPRVPPPIVPQAAVELVRDDSDHGGEGVVPYIPYRAPGTCSPGEFVCEAHGLRPGFFACDASGFALPAACAVNEVCYQYGRSILCDAPGRGAAAASASRGVSY
ncbi:hypothetical protein GQ54DRAFT_295249 [Martensiomyces pterosporus]|nr:hypothetical protein GQ54DRAFT_295249 [Martensiomyces pterosporus]